MHCESCEKPGKIYFMGLTNYDATRESGIGAIALPGGSLKYTMGSGWKMESKV